MTGTNKTYRADPELAQLLKSAARGELRLQIDTDEDSYDIEVADTSPTKKRAISRRQFEERQGIWADYDIEKVRAAFESARGLLEGVDADELVRRMRDERSDDHQTLS